MYKRKARLDLPRLRRQQPGSGTSATTALLRAGVLPPQSAFKLCKLSEPPQNDIQLDKDPHKPDLARQAAHSVHHAWVCRPTQAHGQQARGRPSQEGQVFQRVVHQNVD
eukprot:CAMPEP_0179210102 /NCGR_PEP_ID=MMETSP0796-20121207/104789_1 /TAXON_ID=73915 /ORGANISM="Pyrodinium bahamense, Strain pbaha01" /LENGTH=108 /DNA_ID=CAMNT_0020915067 /DNA_START=369 /DNA_END=696 /DNA_ORIENTATION=-